MNDQSSMTPRLACVPALESGPSASRCSCIRMSGIDYSVQHWQQRAVLAERRLEELRSASPRPGEVALPSPPPRVPHEVLSALNSHFGSSIQVSICHIPCIPYISLCCHATAVTLGIRHTTSLVLLRCCVSFTKIFLTCGENMIYCTR
jgi:hypothetical protein